MAAVADPARFRPAAPRRGGPGATRVPDPSRLRLERYGRAWQQALHTARRLVADFGAARVVAVGALVRPERFDARSEVELVAWGLHADVFAGSVVPGSAGPGLGALPARIRDGDRLSPAAAARVRRDGIELARRADQH